MNEIAGFVWLDGDDSGPPRLELRLTNGAYVLIGYDTDYHCRSLWYAPDKHADMESATTAMTGLSADQLAPFEEQVEQATRAYDSNQRSEWLGDAMSHEDWRL